MHRHRSAATSGDGFGGAGRSYDRNRRQKQREHDSPQRALREKMPCAPHRNCRGIAGRVVCQHEKNWYYSRRINTRLDYQGGIRTVSEEMNNEFAKMLEEVKPDLVHIHGIRWLTYSILESCKKMFIHSFSTPF